MTEQLQKKDDLLEQANASLNRANEVSSQSCLDPLLASHTQTNAQVVDKKESMAWT